MNVLTLEWSEQDRTRIAHLALAIERLADVLEKKGAPASDPLREQLAETLAKVSAPVTPPPPPEAPEALEEPKPEPVVSLAEFQKALTLRCAESADMKVKVRALLNEYAAAASAVPEDKRPEVLARLAEL